MTGRRHVDFVTGSSDIDAPVCSGDDGGLRCRASSNGLRREYTIRVCGADVRGVLGERGSCCNMPSPPSFAAAVADRCRKVNPLQYAVPRQIPDGGVPSFVGRRPLACSSPRRSMRPADR
jgi:hypothetical protein